MAIPKEQRAELISAIDHILYYLIQPMRKDAIEDDVISRKLQKTEDKITNILLDAWSAQSGLAYEKAVNELKKAGKELSEVQSAEIAAGLEDILSKGMLEVVIKDNKLVDHIYYAYDMVGKQTAKKLKVPYAFTIIDQESKDWLQKNTLFWIGQYYDQHVRDGITQTVIEYAINQGQDYWTVGQKIKELLGGTYDVPPKYLPEYFLRAEQYWEGLASAAVTRASVFSQIEPMATADVATYEIINVRDKRLCPLCRHMGGKTFTIEQAADLRDKIISAKNPDDIKNIQAWRKLSDVKDWDRDTLAANGMQLPIYHYSCRCDIIVSTFKDYG